MRAEGETAVVSGGASGPMLYGEVIRLDGALRLGWRT
jgi:hypothetical protein